MRYFIYLKRSLTRAWRSHLLLILLLACAISLPMGVSILRASYQRGDTLQAEVLQLGGAAGGTDKGMSAPVPASGQALPAVQTLDEMERELIVKAIDRSHGNLSQAAAALGITRQTLYNKMKRHGL